LGVAESSRYDYLQDMPNHGEETPVAKIKIPKGRWAKQVAGDRMYAVGTAYRERAERLQSRPATVVESAKSKLQREFRARRLANRS
jgi:hypothetical protein